MYKLANGNYFSKNAFKKIEFQFAICQGLELLVYVGMHLDNHTNLYMCAILKEVNFCLQNFNKNYYWVAKNTFLNNWSEMLERPLRITRLNIRCEVRYNKESDYSSSS